MPRKPQPMAYNPAFPCCRASDILTAGLDEVGRGTLAGPVVSAIVIFRTRDIPLGINDSKKVQEKKREELFAQIHECAHVGIGSATVEEINRLNILEASLLSMRRAYAAAAIKPERLLIDGDHDPFRGSVKNAIVFPSADTLCPSVAAASIIAKVVRDRVMVDLSKAFPCYDWENNKGYGTPKHLEGIKQHGITAHHRAEFGPVRKAIQQKHFYKVIS